MAEPSTNYEASRYTTNVLLDLPLYTENGVDHVTVRGTGEGKWYVARNDLVVPVDNRTLFASAEHAMRAALRYTGWRGVLD